MKMELFKAVSLADQVFEKLEDDIVSGVYAQGEILTELKLADRMNVSRTPIREALRRLEQERLIADSGKGSVVLGITLADLEDIMDIRLRIECLAARHAALNLSNDGAARLREIIDLLDLYCMREDVDNLRRIDDQLHETIYALSGRTVLQDVLRPLHRKTQRYRRKSLSARSAKSTDEHKAICAAILARDAQKAEELMRLHIENARQSIIERFKSNG